MSVKRSCQSLAALLLCLSAADHASAYYAPHLGRWVSRDPIEYGGKGCGYGNGDWNLYEYAGGQPVARLDPQGEYWWIIIPIVLPFLDGCGSNQPQQPAPPPPPPPPPCPGPQPGMGRCISLDDYNCSGKPGRIGNPNHYIPPKPDHGGNMLACAVSCDSCNNTSGECASCCDTCFNDQSPAPSGGDMRVYNACKINCLNK